MKNLIFIFMMGVLLGGCIGSKQVLKKLNKHISEVTAEVDSAGWLVIIPPKVDEDTNTCQQRDFFFFPGVVIWYMRSKVECTIDPDFTYLTIRNAIFQYADSLNLRERIDGDHLNIELLQLPGIFTFKDAEVFLFYLESEISNLLKIIPEPIDLIAEYKIFDGGEIIWEGIIEIPNKQQSFSNLGFNKLIYTYYKELDDELHLMAEALIEEIIKRSSPQRKDWKMVEKD